MTRVVLRELSLIPRVGRCMICRFWLNAMTKAVGVRVFTIAWCRICVKVRMLLMLILRFGVRALMVPFIVSGEFTNKCREKGPIPSEPTAATVTTVMSTITVPFCHPISSEVLKEIMSC